MGCKSCSHGIEVLRRGPIILLGAIATSHSVAVVMGCFDWASHVREVLALILALLLLLLLLLWVGESWGTRWLSDFHSWAKSVFQENASILRGIWIFWRSALLVIVCATWRNRVMVIAALRWNDFLTLEVVGRNSLSLGVLLGTSSTWVEEIVHWLKGSSTLTRYLLVLLCKWILLLYIWKSAEYLPVLNLSVAILLLIYCLWSLSIGYSLINRLSLHLSVSRCFWGKTISNILIIWRQWLHVTVIRIAITILLCLILLTCATWNTVSPICSILWCFYHWWQL